MNPLGLIIVAAGLVSAAGGIMNWDWFMNHRKARFISTVLTRGGARIFYVVLGLGLVALGVLITMGIIRDTGG